MHAPTQACAGSSITLDGSFSVVAGPFPATFKWSLGAGQGQASAAGLSNFLAGVSSSTSLVEVPSDLLDGGTAFDFMLQVVDYVGGIATATRHVERQAQLAPVVSLDTPSSISTDSQSVETVRASAALQCNSSGSRISWLWSVVDLGTNEAVAGLSGASAAFELAGSSLLPPGSRYTVTATACDMINGGESCGDASIEVRLAVSGRFIVLLTPSTRAPPASLRAASLPACSQPAPPPAPYPTSTRRITTHPSQTP